MKRVKIVVVGDGGVGKTCLLISYTEQKFIAQHLPTIFDSRTTTVTVQGNAYLLDLFDSAGQEGYERLRTLSYPQTDVFLVCFSVVLPSSFKNVTEKWIPEIKHHCPHTQFILVGTQCDLRDDPRNDNTVIQDLQMEDEKPISSELGEKLAKELKAFKFLECSALTQKGLKNVFDEAILAALEPPEPPKRKKGCVML